MRPSAAAFDRGNCGGIFIFKWGYFLRTEVSGEMALTDTEIKKTKAKEKAYSLNENGGLYLWITQVGGKLWRWAYRFDGKEKLMSFGKYPDVPLALARERHSEARKLLATGVDPMAQRKAEKTAERIAVENSFQSITTQWLEHWQEGKSPRHVDTVRRRMAADILPCLGARPIAEIEAPELVAMANAIQDRGARDIAKRALETVGQVFRFGIAHGYAKRNPATEIRPSDILKSSPKTNYARVDGRELPTLLRRIEVYQGKQVTRLAMKLMSMTFVRTTELIEAKWGEFDLENARWDIPAERMKMRTPHIVPLARQALEVLEMLRDFTGSNEWLFPGDLNAAQPMSNNTILKALERMGYKGRMTGHGFRGLASTILHEQGYAHDHIELQLAHAPCNAVSAAYNHALYLEPRARMMQDWADFLEHTQRGGKVLPFRGTAA
jgi:integrase